MQSMLDLSTPTVRPDQRLAAEFRPRKLAPWLARLPRTDPDARARWLYKAVSAQNRIAIPAPVRLQLMELYITPFQEVQASPVADLGTIATLPLHPHFRSKRRDMLGLLDALATGYKIAVLDLVGQGRAHGRRFNLSLALQRALYCLIHPGSGCCVRARRRFRFSCWAGSREPVPTSASSCLSNPPAP